MFECNFRFVSKRRGICYKLIDFDHKNLYQDLCTISQNGTVVLNYR